MTDFDKAVPRPLVSSANRPKWLARRAEGVTATEAARLVLGGVLTRERIRHDKENPSESFGGNRHTRRGHDREAYIADWVLRHLGVPADGWLYAHHDKDGWLATPDCIEIPIEANKPIRVAEIKSTTADWSAGIPRLYVLQVLWQAVVLGADEACIVWEQCDDDGIPLTLEPNVTPIPLDAGMIGQLVAAVEGYLAWREAGFPDAVSEFTPEVDEALAQHVAGKALEREAKKMIAEAEATVRSIANVNTSPDGLKAAGIAAVVSFAVTHGDEFDADEAERQVPGVVSAFEAVKQLYRKPKTTTRLNITARKEAA